MKDLLFVFLGGGLGSLSRYGMSMLFLKTMNWQYSPVLSTITSNVLSSMLLMLIWVGIDTGKFDPSLKFLLIVGFCGGFSTFSTFSFETLQFLRQGLFGLAVLNVLISVLVCVALMWIVYKTQIA